MELITPLGTVFLLIDEEPVDFSMTELGPMDNLCPKLEGRFKLEVDFIPDGKEHLISCCLQPSQSVTGYAESGERLESFGYYSLNKKIKVSIGLEAEAGYIRNVTGEIVRLSDTYDYDSEFKEADGLFYNSYFLLPDTKTAHYIFGIAWITGCDQDNDIQTWFGADPTYMKGSD